MAFVLDKRIDTLGTGFAIHITADELEAMGLQPGDDVEIRLDAKGPLPWDRIPEASSEDLEKLAVYKGW